MFTRPHLIPLRSLRIGVPGYFFLLLLAGIQLIHAQDAKQGASHQSRYLRLTCQLNVKFRGQIHVYQITLTKDQSAGVTVQQRGVDVAERLFSPDEKLIALFNSDVRPEATERSDFVAQAPGRIVWRSQPE